MDPISFLYEEDRICIDNGDWLSDAHICICSVKTFIVTSEPEWPLLLSNKLQWKLPNLDFIQIAHIDGNHWICLSNISCLPNICNVYDSMSPQYSSSIVTQVAVIMKCSQACFTILCHISVQMQCGSSDCGLLTIAFATFLCEKKDPSKYSFQQSKMRNHLKECSRSRRCAAFQRLIDVVAEMQ